MDANVSFSDDLKLKLAVPFYFLEWYLRAFEKRFIPITKAVSNWWDVISIILGTKKSATIYFKDGNKFKLNKNTFGKFIILVELAVLPKNIKKEYKFRLDDGAVFLEIEGRKLKLDINVAPQIAGEFYYNRHSAMDVSGRDVIDIGAYVGDTALYYMLRGRANHVYAFEPMPYIFNLGVKMIKENHLQNKITLLNVAVSGKSGHTYVDREETSFGKVDQNSVSKSQKKITVFSLNEIVKKYKINNGALKVDCEGCEYEIFKYASSDTLRRFDQIHIEYHYGYLDLVNRLRDEGFVVSYKKPVFNFKGFSSRSMANGEIIAMRKHNT